MFILKMHEFTVTLRYHFLYPMCEPSGPWHIILEAAAH